MKFIFVLHDGLRDKLYLEIAKSALKKNIECVFLCFSLSSFIFLRKRIEPSFVKLVKCCGHKNINAEIKSSIDVLAGFLSLESAWHIYGIAYNAIESEVIICNDAHKECIIFGGNGLHVFDKAILAIKEHYIFAYTIFTELSNLDKKTFFDPVGSNASSYYYNQWVSGSISISKEKNIDDFLKWKLKFREGKKINHVVRQSPRKDFFSKIKHRALGLIELLFNIPSYQKYKIVDQLYRRTKYKKKIYPDAWKQLCSSFSNVDNYIFFPLQVFGDSQIKLHSSIDNERALELATEIARSNNKTLVVKPHPAETDADAFEVILKLKDKLDFDICTENTFKLIESASKIIVINSTVGLEALLCGKQVDFLGQSFYKFLDNDHAMESYINDYLIDVDIFDPNTIPSETLNKIIKRSGIMK